MRGSTLRLAPLLLLAAIVLAACGGSQPPAIELRITVLSPESSAGSAYTLQGSLSPVSGLSGLVYSLNGGAAQTLTVAPSGAFSSDLSLVAGLNQIVLTGTPTRGEAVTLTHEVVAATGGELSADSLIAAVGETFTLTGDGSLGASEGQVWLNGRQATVESWSEDEVVVTVAAGTPGGYTDLTLVSSNGTFLLPDFFVGVAYAGEADELQAFLDELPLGTAVRLDGDLDLTGLGVLVVNGLSLVGERGGRPALTVDELRWNVNAYGGMLENLALTSDYFNLGRDHVSNLGPFSLDPVDPVGMMVLRDLDIDGASASPATGLMVSRDTMGELMNLPLLVERVEVDIPGELLLTGSGVEIVDSTISSGVSGMIIALGDVRLHEVSLQTTMQLVVTGGGAVELSGETTELRATVVALGVPMLSASSRTVLDGVTVAGQQVQIMSIGGPIKVRDSLVEASETIALISVDLFGQDEVVGNRFLVRSDAPLDQTFTYQTATGLVLFEDNQVEVVGESASTVYLQMAGDEAQVLRLLRNSFEVHSLDEGGTTGAAAYFSIDGLGFLEMEENEIDALAERDGYVAGIEFYSGGAGLRLVGNTMATEDLHLEVGAGGRFELLDNEIEARDDIEFHSYGPAPANLVTGNRFVQASEAPMGQSFYYFSDAEEVTFSGNVLTMDGEDYREAYLEFVGPTALSFEGNEFSVTSSNGTGGGADAGIWIYLEGTMQAVGNSLSAVAEAPGYFGEVGFDLIDGSSELRDNHLVGAIGLELRNAELAFVDNVVVADPAEFAFDIDLYGTTATSLSIEGNHVSGASTGGLYFEIDGGGLSQVAVHGNTFALPFGPGVLIAHVEYADPIDSIDASGNYWNGITDQATIDGLVQDDEGLPPAQLNFGSPLADPPVLP